MSKPLASTLLLGIETEEFFYYTINDPSACIEGRFSSEWIDKENGIQGLYGLPRDSPETKRLLALLFMRVKTWDKTKVDTWVAEHPEYVKPTTPPGIKSVSEGRIKGRLIKAGVSGGKWRMLTEEQLQKLREKHGYGKPLNQKLTEKLKEEFENRQEKRRPPRTALEKYRRGRQY